MSKGPRRLQWYHRRSLVAHSVTWWELTKSVMWLLCVNHEQWVAASQADCQQRIHRKSKELADGVLKNWQNNDSEVCCMWCLNLVTTCSVKSCQVWVAKLSCASLQGDGWRDWSCGRDWSSKRKTSEVRYMTFFCHIFVTSRHTLFFVTVSWWKTRNTLPGRLLGILVPASDFVSWSW